MPFVACVGIATLDLLMTVDELPNGDGKYSARSYAEIGGGVAANAAVTVARLGGRASLTSALGDDDVGRRIIAGLTEEGVSTAGVQRVADATSPVSFVLVDGAGERSIVNHTTPLLFELADPAQADLIGRPDAVLVDCRWPLGARRALEVARELGVPGVVDYDRPVPAGGLEILATASHVLFSEEALLATASGAPLDTLRALETIRGSTTAWIGVTQGALGSLWIDDKGSHRMPAIAVDAVDTAGAGDVFHGAFALALAEQRDETAAMGFATAAAAAKCRLAGARAGIPDRAMVDRLLHDRAPRTTEPTEAVS